jgi:hypothetical protein
LAPLGGFSCGSEVPHLEPFVCLVLVSLSSPFSSKLMDGWNKLQSSLSGLNLGQSANKFAKGFNSSVQATRERLGQVAPDEITELPQGGPALLYFGY